VKVRITFYDKSTCGTCKKAKAFLNDHDVSFNIVDIVAQPPSRELLEATIDETNVKAFLNPRSAIYRERKLGQNIPTKAAAINLMLEDPNLIKRPVILKDEAVTFGFDPDDLEHNIVS
jgi:arsenate reductase